MRLTIFLAVVFVVHADELSTIHPPVTHSQIQAITNAIQSQQSLIRQQEKVIGELRSSFEAVCQELKILSRHVVFHEKTLKVIGHHVDYRHHIQALVKAEVSTEASTHDTTTFDPETLDITEAPRVHRKAKGPDTCPSCNCSILQELIPVGLGDVNNPDLQYLKWMELLNDNETTDDVHKKLTSSESSATYVDGMEEAMKREDLVYATCNVVPNRHISLILQQNVFGVINLWQKKDGQSPVFMHVNVSGFRVPEADTPGRDEGRRRRETIMMPLETPPPPPAPPTQQLVSYEHGFHVHTNGDLSRSCQSTGVHFNPMSVSHGGPMDDVKHVGDLGNLKVDRDGKIDAELTFSHVSLVGGNGIIGRSLVIHAQADDYGRNKESESSMATGNSGPKIACCLIEKVDQLLESADSKGTVQAIRAPSTPAEFTTTDRTSG